MKNILFLIFVIALYSSLAKAQQVISNLTVKDFKVESTTKASLPCPSMNETQRNAISPIVAGRCVYNTTTSKINTYNGTTWKVIGNALENWVTSFAYSVDDVVIESNKIYQCLTAHTSGTFSTDLGTSKWLRLSTDVGGATGTLLVANGGTGQTSLTANSVILGNGTSAVQFVAPSTSGNILKSNGTTWQSVAGGSTVAAKYVSTSGQSIPNATETTITFPTSVYDTNSAMSSGVFTCPTGQAGYYQVNGIVTFPNGTTGVRFGYVRGSAIGYSSISRTGSENPTNSTTHSVRYSDTVYLNAGDTVFLTAYQTSGGSLSLNTEGASNIFTIVKVGN